MIDPGKMRERVSIERFVVVKDDGGALQKTWSTIAHVWAMVRAQTAGNRAGNRERVAADALQYIPGYRVIIRKRDVSTEDRLIWNGRPYNIRSVVDPDGLGAHLEMFVEGGVASG